MITREKRGVLVDNCTNHEWCNCEHRGVGSIGSNLLCPLISPFLTLAHQMCFKCGMVRWNEAKYEKVPSTIPNKSAELAAMSELAAMRL